MIMENSLIGIMGSARSGKDTAYMAIKELFPDKIIERRAFADELKKECDAFLKENLNISAFTENTEEKEIIRPFLVTYGTHLRRRLNPSCWIESLEETLSLRDNKCICITDTRFENEARWIKSKGGKLIFIDRSGISPANIEEEQNNPVLMSLADMVIKMPTFREDYFSKCRSRIREELSKWKT